jgi:hypothetical protein
MVIRPASAAEDASHPEARRFVMEKMMRRKSTEAAVGNPVAKPHGILNRVRP